MNANAPNLTEAVRVPLHELQADVDYLIGRVAADGSCASMIGANIKAKLTAIENAILVADQGFTPNGQAVSAQALADKISRFAKIRLCFNPTGDSDHQDWLVHERDRHMITKALRLFHEHGGETLPLAAVEGALNAE